MASTMRNWSRRQVVFVTGEPGIGKTSLADAFLEQTQSAHVVQRSRTASVSIITAPARPYLPLIEELDTLG